MRKWFIFILLAFSLWPLEASYQVCFEGVESEEILETIEAISQLKSESERPPPSLFTLKKRAESDKKTIIQALHAYGYYDADVEMVYMGEFPTIMVRIEIEQGVQYLFNSLCIHDEEQRPILISASALNVKIGCPARSDVILDTQEQIIEELANCGYPLAKIASREVVVDQQSKEVSVAYLVETGPLAYFGQVCIEGLRKIKPGFVCRKIMWKTGELYHPKLVECTNAYILESGLFSFVSVRPADSVDEEGYLPMLIALEEKKFRHVGAGVSYSTDESAGVMFQWSHDSLRGWGDTFAFTGEYSEVIKRATLLYGIPDFYRRNQDLLYSGELRREDAPGFIDEEASFLVRISRKVTDYFSFNYGGRFEKLISTKSDNDENYNLLSLPIQIRFDTSDRLLNPTSGTTISYFFTPFTAILNSHVSFLKQELWFATYQPLTSGAGVILAGSAQFGSIVGQSRILIPAPKRFYAGSSVGLRGYKYLSVSPLEGRKPIGGRSLMIFQIEPRFRIYNQLYFTTFYDFGNVYATPFPRLSEKILNSVGIGIRYLTPVGPFRLDIAFPLNRREGIDKSFQIYANVGQTF